MGTVYSDTDLILIWKRLGERSQSILSPQFDILSLLASQGYHTAHPSERFHNVRTF